jgi:uncharacterized protein YqeY
MEILDTIKSDMIAARKARSPVATTLITLKGEVDSKEKSFSPARPITNEEVVAVVKKFLKGTDETIRLLSAGERTDALDAAYAEKKALEAYLPKQMTEGELTDFARSKVSDGANIGVIMGALKSEKAGHYDGKLASQVVKKVLAES